MYPSLDSFKGSQSPLLTHPKTDTSPFPQYAVIYIIISTLIHVWVIASIFTVTLWNFYFFFQEVKFALARIPARLMLSSHFVCLFNILDFESHSELKDLHIILGR